VCNTTTGLAAASFQGAATDGTRLVFTTEQELLPGQSGPNLFEYDLAGPSGEKISSLASGPALPEVQGVVRVTPNGARVYFVAKAALTATPNVFGQSATPGRDNLYMSEKPSSASPRRLAFVTYARPSDQECTKLREEGAEEACASDEELWRPNDSEREAAASEDGRYLLFATSVDVTPDDTSNIQQIFRYDGDTGEIVRISIGQAGFNNNGNTDDESLTPRFDSPNFNAADSFIQTEFANSQAMSTDGSYVTFASSNALVPGALEHVRNVYLYHGGEVALLTPAQVPSQPDDASTVAGFGLSASGHDVFFVTPLSLVPSDLDTQSDLYDARIEGGFAATASSECVAPGCRPPGQVIEPFGPPASTGVVGGGNIPPPVLPKATSTNKPKTRAQLLGAALKHCKALRRKRRAVCERATKRRYASKRTKHVNQKGTKR
jgi:hypothetical protein